MSVAIAVQGLRKTFTLHTQGGQALPVLRGVHLTVAPGECVALADPSGSGKSTLLRCIYGNYRPQAGYARVRHGAGVVDMVAAEPRVVLDVRRRSLGYVSQFLRVIPRVPALEIVAEPLRAVGVPRVDALARAAAVLERLRIPARLLAHRLLVMRHGRVVEEGLTDRVLDDPQHPYTQLLVSSVLAA